MKIALIDESIPTQIPSYATPGAAGLDLYATRKTEVPRTFDAKKQRWVGGYIEYGTNIAVEIPDGFVGLLTPKSSSRDYSQSLANDLGVIDEDYRGELKFSYVPSTSSIHYTSEYQIGDQVGQLLLVSCKRARIHHVPFAELSVTERGTGGHGSTSEPKTTTVATEQAARPLTPENAFAAVEGTLPQDTPAPSEDGTAPESTPTPTTEAETPVELPDLTQGGEVPEPTEDKVTENGLDTLTETQPVPTEAIPTIEELAASTGTGEATQAEVSELPIAFEGQEAIPAGAADVIILDENKTPAAYNLVAADGELTLQPATPFADVAEANEALAPKVKAPTKAKAK